MFRKSIRVVQKINLNWLSFSNLWLAILFGAGIFFCTLYFLQVTDRLQRGEHGQIAIQLLDDMRRPLFAIKAIEKQFIEADNPEAALAVLNETAKQAKLQLDRYRQAAAYNTVVAEHAERFTAAYHAWVSAEHHLMVHADPSPETGSDEVHLAQHLSEANTLFLSTMEELGNGEHPIHQDIDEGRQALYILQWSGALLVLYLFFLILHYQYVASRRLAAKQKNLDKTLQCIGDAVIATDHQGLVTRMNPVAEQLTGWKASEAHGRPLPDVFKIVNTETGESVENPVDKVMRENSVVGMANHTLLIAHDGSRYHIADSGAPIRDASGSITGVVLVFRDVTEEYNLQQSAHEHSLRLQGIIETAMDAVIVTDGQGIILEWNPQAETMFGWPRDEIIGHSLNDTIIPLSQRDAHQQCLTRLVETGVPRMLGQHIETNALHRDGYEFPIELTLNRLHQGEDWLFSAFIRDMTKQKTAEEELRLAATTFNSHAGIVITDSHASILRVNPAFEAMTGYEAKEIIGQNPSIFQSGRQDKEFYRCMWSTIRENGQWQGELWNRRKDGSHYAEWLTITAVKNTAGEITHYVGTSQDITERKKAESRLEYLAYHDDLTDLANRRLLHDRIDHEIALAKRHGSFGALLYFDLDQFKHLNDALGHPIGDELLCQLAKRLKKLMRSEDTVARVGGDEFVILLPMLSHDQSKASIEAKVVAEKIRSQISLPFDLQGHLYHINASIGITLFPEADDNADDMLKHADSALYLAKDEGRNTTRFYHPSMQAIAEERLILTKDLRHAIKHNELLLHYQPQVNMAGELIGAEALVRWQHPEKGMVLPSLFIHAAEDSGLILELGDWVLSNAAKQLNAWQQKGFFLSAPRLAVNVSPLQFQQPHFVKNILSILDKEGVSPKHIELEITESLFMNNVDEAINKMLSLKQSGIRFAIDDFGTGYSSLSHLKQLPVDKLKIDRSFVCNVTSNTDDAAIIETIIAMTNHLKLGVIAEGVEIQEQVDFLKKKGCTTFQGYYFSPPVPAEEFYNFFTS